MSLDSVGSAKFCAFFQIKLLFSNKTNENFVSKVKQKLEYLQMFLS